MIKKVLALAGAAVIALSLSACGGQMEQLAELEPVSSGIDWAPTEAASFDDSLDGLCKYLETNKAVAGEKDYMSYKEIGAVEGCRYRFKFDGSTVQTEFYEFDLDNLDEKGKECVSSVKEKGSFTVLGNEAPAVLNGKYLMVYTDGDNDEANAAHRDKVLELFNAFTPEDGK